MSVDVVIAGAGPAGSVTAALLARAGHEVLVFEREEFPRFHIGESLLPLGLSALDRLEVAPTPEVFVDKRGARFLCETTGKQVVFDFSEAFGGPPRTAFQVERSTFDMLLRDRAVALGAEVRHGVTVTDVAIDDAVRVTTSHGSVSARYFVDATGMGRLLAKQWKTVAPYRQFGRAASFRHYGALTDDALEALGPAGQVVILIVDDGWAWIIPLPDRRISVGIVSRRGGMKPDDVDALVADSPLLQRLTAGAEAGPARLISSFAYANTRPCGPRFVCVGDSACFLDPVFSSGVSLALAGAEEVADTLGPALNRGDEADPELMTAFQARMHKGYGVFAALIDRFYNTKLVDNLFFGAPDDGVMRPGIVSILAGDVWREDNPFHKMLVRSRRKVPQPEGRQPGS